MNPLVEYAERLAVMSDDELRKELVRVNACIGVAASKELQRPFFARRRLVEAMIGARQASVDRATEYNGWNLVLDKYPDADEAVLGLHVDITDYRVVAWNGVNWTDVHSNETTSVTHWMRLTGILAPPEPVPAGGAR